VDWQRIEDLLREWFTPMPRVGLVVVLVVALALTFFAFAAWRRWLQGLRGMLWTALVAVVSAILIATLGFRIGDAPPSGKSREIILEPFEGMRRAADLSGTRAESANFYGNILLFIPLGFVLVFLLYGWLIGRVATAALLGAALSGGIELSQTTMARAADINDIILNGTGAALGACLACGVLIVSRIWKAIGRWVSAAGRPRSSELGLPPNGPSR
jgi:glycopeptide antibiotics resistance protein